MSAVAEEVYTMPKACVGMTVQWFHQADRSNPTGALVVRASERSIAVVTYNRQLMDRGTVRHMSDPELQHNHRLREFGAWDYLPEVETSTNPAEITQMKQMLARLTDRLGKLETKKNA